MAHVLTRWSRSHAVAFAIAATVIGTAAGQVVAAQTQTTAVEGIWVWFGGHDGAPRHLRRTFDLPTQPTAATLAVTADNAYTVYLNGEKLGGDSAWESVDRYDVAARLRPGKNLLAIEARNQGGSAGVFARLDAVLPGGKKFAVGTDADTRVSLDAVAAWLDPAFDDSAWGRAAVLGDAGMEPWHIGVSAGGAVAKGANNLAQTHTLEPSITAPVPADRQLPHFVVPEGFRVELVAAEPLVINPVTIATDERGRLYVSESHTYRYGPGGTPVKPYTNPIIRLEPQPDGSLKRELVAEGFEDPVMGIAIRDGKLWAAANNYLYQFTLPTTGPATDRKLLVEDKNKAWNPFGMFVLEWGPDGLLYMSVGNHAVKLVGPNNTLESRGASGVVVRMKPDGTDMELLTQGFRVPYSFDLDPFGQLWLLSNGEGNPNRFARIIEGVDYHCFTRNVDNTWLAGRHRLSPPAFELPGGAHTQLLRYYDAAYPEQYRGSLFLDNWGRHGFTGANRAVFRYVTDDRNTVVETEPFVSCGDPHFRVSHILLEPQGDMLLSDWYGRDDESDLTGRIWRVRYEGADKPAVPPALATPDWAHEAATVAALSSPRGLVREQAANRLVTRGATVIPAVRAEAAGGREPLGAAMALWTLARIGTADSRAALADGARHPDWKVRRLALGLMRRFDAAGRQAVAERLVRDEDLAVRLEAIRGLSSAAAIQAALVGLTKTTAIDDDHLRYELAWIMARNLDRGMLHTLLASDSDAVRRLGELVIDIAAHEKFDGYQVALEGLQTRLTTAPADQLDTLLTLARMHGTPAMIPTLATLAGRQDLPAAIAGKAILAIRGFSNVPPQVLADVGKRFLEAVDRGQLNLQSTADWLLYFDLIDSGEVSAVSLRRIGSQFNGNDGRVRERAHELARTFGPRAASLADPLARLLRQKGLKPEQRTEALVTLAAVEAPPRTSTWEPLLASDDPFLRREAVRWWRLFKNTPTQAEAATILLGKAPQLVEQDAALRGDLAIVLRDLGVPPAEMASLALPEPVDDKAKLAEATLAAIGSLTGEEQKLAALHGRTVFARVGCVKCHTTVFANTLRAPSLKGIGQAQKPPYLVESILTPSAILKTGFETERIETADGRVFTGLVKEEGDSLRVITADDEKVVRKADVEDRAVQKVSLMPEGQEKLLSPAEFADLIAYLISLR